MATVSSVTKHFPSAKEGFVTTLASTIAAGAATVPLNSVTGYTNGQVAVLVVEPGSATNKQVVTGTVDTAGVQLTGCVWTEGSNTTHNAGSTVVDYVSATHMSMVSKGILVEHNQNGTHAAVTATSIVVSGSVTASSFVTSGTGTDNGWTVGLTAPTTVTYNGNRSYDLVVNATDLTSLISPGTRLRLTRTTAASTQCTSLNGTSQYYSKTSPSGTTFTDDFCVGGWFKLSGYPSAAAGVIASRYNGTSGWTLRVLSSGRVELDGFSGGSANYGQVSTYQSVPANRWVHVVAQLDMSAFTATTTTSYVMLDGVDVPAFVARGGTNPASLTQAGNLEIGVENAGTYFFPGKLSNVFYSSAKITQANVRTLQGQDITSALCTANNIVSAFTFNNTLNDVNTTSANNLTANGAAVATNSDSPFAVNGFGTPTGTLEYAIITKAVFSTNTTLTVQVPEGNALPTSGTIAAAAYSAQKAPYGMPTDDPTRWNLYAHLRTDFTVSSPVQSVWNEVSPLRLTYPVGVWTPIIKAPLHIERSTAGPFDASVCHASASASATLLSNQLSAGDYSSLSGVTGGLTIRNVILSNGVSVPMSASTTTYVNFLSGTTSVTFMSIRGGRELATHCAVFGLL